MSSYQRQVYGGGIAIFSIIALSGICLNKRQCPEKSCQVHKQ